MDPSSAIGLGHLVRLACLRDALAIPAHMLGGVDARLSANGLRVRYRRRARRLDTRTRVVVVDRNYIDANIIAWKLANRRNLVIWIRRGLVRPSQALAQSGFLAFADLVIVPGDTGADTTDPLCDLADQQGKLAKVDICHAYQVVRPRRTPPAPVVFMALGAFEERLRPIHLHVRDVLAAADIPVVWSAYSDLPIAFGFPASERVAIADALRVKAQCAGLVSEGGYNSLHEALFLSRPALFIANDANGRELQSLRVRAARQSSALAFDAFARDDIEEWSATVRDDFIPSQEPRVAHEFAGNGFAQMARIVEEVCISH